MARRLRQLKTILSSDDTCTYGNGSLRNLDFLLWTMGRNVSEGGGSISGAAEDDGNGRSMSEAAEVRQMTVEDDGSVTEDGRRQREWRKLLEDDRRWRFDVLQSHFQRVGRGHAYHRTRGNPYPWTWVWVGYGFTHGFLI